MKISRCKQQILEHILSEISKEIELRADQKKFIFIIHDDGELILLKKNIELFRIYFAVRYINRPTIVFLSNTADFFSTSLYVTKQNYKIPLNLEQGELSISQLNLIMLDPDIKELIQKMKKCLE